jgi:hypothetical protein
MGLAQYWPSGPCSRTWCAPSSCTAWVCARALSERERDGPRCLGDAGSCRGLDRVFHSGRRRASDRPTAGRRIRGRPRWFPRVPRRRRLAYHVLQHGRLARRVRWRRHDAVDPEPAWRPLREHRPPPGATWPYEALGPALRARQLVSQRTRQIKTGSAWRVRRGRCDPRWVARGSRGSWRTAGAPPPYRRARRGRRGRRSTPSECARRAPR